MNTRYTTFKTDGKAPRPLWAWSGPWSMSTLHELEYLQCKPLDRQAATASDVICYSSSIYNTQVISYDLSFITILFIFSIVTCLIGILILIFAFHQCRSIASGPSRVVSICGKFRRPRMLVTKIKLRQNRNQLDPYQPRFKLPMPHFSSSRVYSYLRWTVAYLFGGSSTPYDAQNGLSYLQRRSKPSSGWSCVTSGVKNGSPYLRKVPGCPGQRSGLRNCVGDKLRRRGRFITCTLSRACEENNSSDWSSFKSTGKDRRRTSDKQAKRSETPLHRSSLLSSSIP